MTHTTESMANAEKIAAGLTEAQRRTLLDGFYIDENWTPPRPRVRGHGKVKWNLCRQRLLRDYLGAPTVTPLGQQVREILRRQS